MGPQRCLSHARPAAGAAPDAGGERIRSLQWREQARSHGCAGRLDEFTRQRPTIRRSPGAHRAAGHHEPVTCGNIASTPPAHPGVAWSDPPLRRSGGEPRGGTAYRSAVHRPGMPEPCPAGRNDHDTTADPGGTARHRRRARHRLRLGERFHRRHPRPLHRRWRCWLARGGAERRPGAPGGGAALGGPRASPAGRGGQGWFPLVARAAPPAQGPIRLACGPPPGRPVEGAVVAMTEPDAPATLCEAFQHTVARHPGDVALRTVGGAVPVTWGSYAGRVAQIAAGLAALGVRRGDTVALMMTNRPEFHLADTAAFHLGAVPFSVYNTSAGGQIAHVLADAGARVVVCEEQFAARLLAVVGGTAVHHVVCIDGHPGGTLTLEELMAGGDPGFGFEKAWRAVAPGDL